MSRLLAGLVATVLCAVATSGCGVGPGPSSEGEAELSVTRDYGAEHLIDATTTDPSDSDTVVRFLDREADIETSYGGNFVDVIDGLAGSTAGGGEEDWFFFVNGFYSEIGAGEARLYPGDKVWWDYREWAAAYQVPAVVGSWPQPFVDGYQGRSLATVVECLTPATEQCEEVADALRDEGVEPTVESPAEPIAHPDDLRVLVGPWDALRSDPAARGIERGPQSSGVFADFGRCDDDWRLTVLDQDAEVVESLEGAALVAAVRDGIDQPTWLITGTDESAVASAAGLLDAETLRDNYALATGPGGEVRVPAEPIDSGADAPDAAEGACA